MAYLLRELNYIQENAPENIWATHLKNLLKETIHFEKELGDDYAQRAWMKEETKVAFNKLIQLEAYGETAKRLKKSLLRHDDKLWHYIEQQAVPSTNNASERALRNVKVKQKVSTAMRTLLGTEIFCKLRSIAETCKNRGLLF